MKYFNHYILCVGLFSLTCQLNAKIINVRDSQYIKEASQNINAPEKGDSIVVLKDNIRTKNSQNRQGSEKLPPVPPESKVMALPVNGYIPILILVAIVLIFYFGKRKKNNS